MNIDNELDYLRKNTTILYVEDDENIRGQLAHFLNRRCAKLYQGENGLKGLELFEKHQPDIIVTDILMPGMDGLSMSEAIRLINPKIPIIITSAFEESRYFYRAIDLGVDKYVVKPVDLEVLEKALIKCTSVLRAEAALKELQQRTIELQEAQRIAGLGHWRFNFLNQTLSWSTGLLQIFELETAQSSYETYLSYVHPEDRHLVEKSYKAHLEKNVPYDIEHRILLSSGQVKYIHERRQTERDEQGNPVSTLSTIQNISARKLNELELEQHRLHLEELISIRTKELEKAKDDAESASRAKSVFLANMSHELRTPLNAILGFTQLIERDRLLNKEHQKELQMISRAGQCLLMLINDVLEISRIEAGHSAVQIDTLDFQELLFSIEEIIRVQADVKKLSFNVERFGSIPHFVRADGSHLRQVLINLLGNAVKYTEKGSVILRLTPINNAMRIDVIDTGVGIAEQDLRDIFHAFYQTKSYQTESGIDKNEGTGLGLTISQEFVRLMGGEISVTSVLGQGSTFSFTIPLPEVNAPVLCLKSQSPVISLAPGQPRYRILVVDDNEDNRILLTRVLERVGFDAKAVENGKQAIEAFETWLPDFIWMDMRMPIMDGYEATKRIRALPNGQQVKIAALTASAFTEDRDSILSVGCDDMITKPLSEDALFEVMKTLLGIEYSYAQPEESCEVETITLDLRFLTPDLKEELLQAAELLDIEAAESVACKIANEHPKQSQALVEAIASFNFDLILHAMNPV